MIRHFDSLFHDQTPEIRVYSVVESRYPNMNGFLQEEDWLIVLIGGEMWNGQDKTCKSEKGWGRKGPYYNMLYSHCTMYIWLYKTVSSL